MDVKLFPKYPEPSIDDEKSHTIDNYSVLAGADEAYIWEKFKSGNESAFVHIYNSYFEKLLNIGYQLTKDKSLIMDCIQDLFIDLINKRSNLGEVKCIKLYLYKSFRRRLLKYIQFTRKNHARENDLGHQTYHIEISQEERLMNIQTDEHQKERIKKGIITLTEKEREAIYYFYYQNLSYSEMCEIFNYTQVKTVRNLVYQALKKLRLIIHSLVLIPFLIY